MSRCLKLKPQKLVPSGILSQLKALKICSLKKIANPQNKSLAKIPGYTEAFEPLWPENG